MTEHPLNAFRPYQNTTEEDLEHCQIDLKLLKQELLVLKEINTALAKENIRLKDERIPND